VIGFGAGLIGVFRSRLQCNAVRGNYLQTFLTPSILCLVEMRPVGDRAIPPWRQKQRSAAADEGGTPVIKLDALKSQRGRPLLLAVGVREESGRQSCLKIDLFSGDGVVEFEELGVQEVSSIAGKAGEIFKRLTG